MPGACRPRAYWLDGLRPPCRPPREDSLLRIVVFTAEKALADSLRRRLSVLSPALDALVLCPRVIGSRTHFVASGLTPRDDTSSAPGVPGSDVLDLADSLRRLTEWGADIAVAVGDVIIPVALRQVAPAPLWTLRAGWCGGGSDVTEAARIGALITPESITGAPEAIAAAVAPVYSDDSLLDLEHRGAELCVSLLHETLDQLMDGRSPASPSEVDWHRWPTGIARAKAELRLRARRLARRIADPNWLLKSLAAVIILALVAPVRAVWRTIRRRHAVHVFTFHRVSDLCRDGMTISPRVFRRQVAAIRRSHRIVTIDEAVALHREGARLARPVAAITFDDAYRSVVDEAAPVLAAAGVTGAVFVSTGVVGREARFAHDDSSRVRPHLPPMEWRDLDALHAAGWSIGAHTITHPRLSRCDGPTLERELGEPITLIAERFGPNAVPFAYPFGGTEDITAFARRLVEGVGYSVCLSDFGGENIPPGDPFRMRRIELGGDHATLAWRVRVQGLDLQNWRPRWLSPARGAGVVHAA